MQELPSTKPYLIRAIWEWCNDNGYTPHIAVTVDARTRVPREFVREGQIVLNVGGEACSRLQMGNDWIEFQARFGGVARDISVPVDQIAAIYARENGAGMAFEIDMTLQSQTPADIESDALTSVESDDVPPEPPQRPDGGKPKLLRIK